MAAYSTTFHTSQVEAAYKRNVQPSFRGVQMDKKVAVFDYTFAGTEADDEIITLGYLGIPGAKVIPEESRIRDTGGAQDIDVSVKLTALVGGLTATDLSGTVAFDNNTLPFVTPVTTALVELGATDTIRLEVDDASIGAVTAGETISVEVTYFAPRAN